MTKFTKKENQRSNTKYPALDKNKNLPSRRDYIEPDYINGIYNEKGEEVIRPLNEEEKQYLNKFYEETIVTNFLHNSELRNLSKLKKNILEDDVVKSLKNDLDKLKKESKKNKKEINNLKQIIKLTKKQNEEIYEDDLKVIESEFKRLRKKYLLFNDPEDHKKFYNANNARNVCLYNKIKTERRLEFIGDPTFDEERLSEQDYDGEEEIINKLERHLWEEMEERLERIIEEEKQSKKD